MGRKWRRTHNRLATARGGRSVSRNSAMNERPRRRLSGVSGASMYNTRPPRLARNVARWCLLKRVGPDQGGAYSRTMSANLEGLSIDRGHLDHLALEGKARLDAHPASAAHARSLVRRGEQVANRS